MELCMSMDLHEELCGEEAVESITFPGYFRFCKSHQEQLNQIREELESGSWERNIRNKDSAVDRFCVSPGCPNRPLYGDDYCPSCRDDG